MQKSFKIILHLVQLFAHKPAVREDLQKFADWQKTTPRVFCDFSSMRNIIALFIISMMIIRRNMANWIFDVSCS